MSNKSILSMLYILKHELSRNCCGNLTRALFSLRQQTEAISTILQKYKQIKSKRSHVRLRRNKKFSTAKFRLRPIYRRTKLRAKNCYIMFEKLLVFQADVSVHITNTAYYFIALLDRGRNNLLFRSSDSHLRK